MPEAAQPIHDTKDLEQQVGDLLQQMEAGTQRLAAEVAAAPPLPTPAPPPAPASGAAPTGQAAPGAPAGSVEERAALDAAAAELAAAVTPAPSGAAAVAPAGADPSGPDLAAAVEKLISESPATKAEAPAAAATGKIESLDAELAGLADRMIAGEFQGESAVVKDEKPVAAPVLEAPKPEPVAPKEPADAAPVVAPPAPKPEAAPKPEPVTPREPADAAPGEPAPVAPAPKRAPSAAVNAGKVAAAAAKPAVLRLFAAVSAPLQSRPQLRDILGWVALVQAFLAMCVWVWVLFVRSDKAVDPPPVNAVQERSAEDEHSNGHEGEHASRQATAKKAKKPAKKPAHGSTGEGGHH